jgi:hypothetical protein
MTGAARFTGMTFTCESAAFVTGEFADFRTVLPSAGSRSASDELPLSARRATITRAARTAGAARKIRGQPHTWERT